MTNEKRLIDANALMEKLSRMIEYCKTDDKVNALTALFQVGDAVMDCPTIDAVEVVHGLWKYYRKQNIAVCTNCSFERDLDANFGKAVSCPNCGAKMDGERKDNG